MAPFREPRLLRPLASLRSARPTGSTWPCPCAGIAAYTRPSLRFAPFARAPPPLWLRLRWGSRPSSCGFGWLPPFRLLSSFLRWRKAPLRSFPFVSTALRFAPLLPSVLPPLAPWRPCGRPLGFGRLPSALRFASALPLFLPRRKGVRRLRRLPPGVSGSAGVVVRRAPSPRFAPAPRSE